MGALIRMELGRALRGRMFVTALVIGGVIGIVAAAGSAWGWWASMESAQDPTSSFTNQFAQGAWTLWMPLSVMRSVPNLFFLLAPLLVALAYAWSWRSDVMGGYVASVSVRTTRERFYAAKAFAAFVSGSLVVVVPLLVNLALTLCLVPAYAPDITDVVYTGLWEKVFLSSLLYSCPQGYVVARFLIDALLAGLWATTVLALSLPMRNRVAIMALPFIALLVVKYVSERIYVLAGVRLSSLTILDQLKARGDSFYYEGWALAVDVLVMLAISVVVPMLMRRRDVL